jgi:hypothetical protein
MGLGGVEFLKHSKCLNIQRPSPSSPHTVVARIGADMMHRRCRFVYVVQQIRSRQCGTKFPVTSTDSDYSSVEITCENVQNSHCRQEEAHPPPICGYIDDFKYELLNASGVDWRKPSSQSLTVNITFVPRKRRGKSHQQLQPLYYLAVWGDAEPYSQSEEVRSIFNARYSILSVPAGWVVEG